MRVSTLLRAVFCGVGLCLAGSVLAPEAKSKPPSMPILEYIKRTWIVLKRSHEELASMAVDPKFRPLPGGRWPVYVPDDEDITRVEQDLRRVMKPADLEKIELRRLPENAATTG